MYRGKILQLITGLGVGGAEQQMVQMASFLRQRGWDVSVVSMIHPEAFTAMLEERGIPLFCLDMPRGFPDPKGLVKFLSIIERNRPDLIHSHMYHANILARVTKFFNRCSPLVCTAHNIDEGGSVSKWLYRLTDRFADLTTQVSRAGLARYVRIGAAPAGRIVFVPNGVDTDFFCPRIDIRECLRSKFNFGDKFVWLAAGRLEPQKNYPCMLHAFANVASDRDDVLLAIAGQGSEYQRMKGLISQFGLDNKVRLLGLCKDMVQLLASADAYLMSSDWEGLPMVLLEASACELPIVATNVGGNAEVVQHGISGFLVPPADVHALTEAMSQLMLLHPEKRAAMGKAARLYIKNNYSLHRVVERWEAVYKKVIDKKACNIL